jgi:hypothetical protein
MVNAMRREVMRRRMARARRGAGALKSSFSGLLGLAGGMLGGGAWAARARGWRARCAGRAASGRRAAAGATSRALRASPGAGGPG